MAAENLQVETVTNGRWRENCYIAVKNGEALVIDPGGDAAGIKEKLRTTASSPVAVLLTHGHYDHIGAAAEIKEHFSVPLYASRGDSRLINQANLYRSIFDSDEVISIPAVDVNYEDLSLPFAIGGFSVEVFFSPGHTKGSTCLGIEGCWFTGDTLFRKSIGRTDLPGGSAEALVETLRRFVRVPREGTIYPGHGRPTTLAAELRDNLELQEAISGCDKD